MILAMRILFAAAILAAARAAGFSAADNRISISCALAAADADIVCLQEAPCGAAGEDLERAACFSPAVLQRVTAGGVVGYVVAERFAHKLVVPEG